MTICIVYFDQLSGDACTQKLVKILFGILIVFLVFGSGLLKLVDSLRRVQEKKEKGQE